MGEGPVIVNVSQKLTPMQLPYGDFMRVFAAFCVIVQHVAHQGIIFAKDIADTSGWWSYVWANALTRWVVPVFVMLSGALILDPARKEPVGTFYRKRLPRVGIPTVAWSVFYIAFGMLAFRATLGEGIEAFVRGVPAYHLHFMFIILGLYVITPVLRGLTDSVDHRLAWFVAVLWLAAASLSATYQLQIMPANALNRWVPYVGYFVLGLLIRNVRMTALTVTIGGLGFVTATIVLGLSTGRAWAVDGWGASSAWMMNFLSPAVVVQSLAVFILLQSVRSISNDLWHRRMNMLAAASLGVYLIHPAWLEVVRRFLPVLQQYGPIVNLIAVTIIVTVASCASIILIKRLPLMRYITG